MKKPYVDPYERPDCIKLEDCKHRGLYRLFSRNLAFGVFNEKSQGFCGLRTKFNRIYVFEEHHKDYDGPFKTAVPLELLPDELPADIEPIENLPGSLCDKCNQPCDYANWPEGGEREITMKDGFKMHVRGQWQHLDGTRCEDMGGYIRGNIALHRWLEEMEKKHAKST